MSGHMRDHNNFGRYLRKVPTVFFPKRTDLNDLVSLIFTNLLILLTEKHSDAIKLTCNAYG